MKGRETSLRIGSLTRMLRDSLRESGADRAIAEAAEAIPDARPSGLRQPDARGGGTRAKQRRSPRSRIRMRCGKE